MPYAAHQVEPDRHSMSGSCWWPLRLGGGISVGDDRNFWSWHGHSATPASRRWSGDCAVLVPDDGSDRGQYSWHEVGYRYRGCGAEQDPVGPEGRLQRPGDGVTYWYSHERQHVVKAAEPGQDLVGQQLLDGGIPVVVQDRPAADADGRTCGHHGERQACRQCED